MSDVVVTDQRSKASFVSSLSKSPSHPSFREEHFCDCAPFAFTLGDHHLHLFHHCSVDSAQHVPLTAQRKKKEDKRGSDGHPPSPSPLSSYILPRLHADQLLWAAEAFLLPSRSCPVWLVKACSLSLLKPAFCYNLILALN